MGKKEGKDGWSRPAPLPTTACPVKDLNSPPRVRGMQGADSRSRSLKAFAPRSGASNRQPGRHAPSSFGMVTGRTAGMRESQRG